MKSSAESTSELEKKKKFIEANDHSRYNIHHKLKFLLIYLVQESCIFHQKKN